MPTDSSCCKRLLSIVFVVCGFTHFVFAKAIDNQPLSDSTAILADTVNFRLEGFKPNIRADMVAYAKEFLGIHYRYAGRSPNTGFDCSGFTHFVMRNFAVNISTSSRGQIGYGKKVELKSVKPGDLIFFRRSSKSRISHVAMVVSNDENGLYIIHSTSRGVVVDNLMKSKYWRPKIYTARDVLHQFSDDYARQQTQLFLAQRRQLQEMNVDLALLAKGIRL